MQFLCLKTYRMKISYRPTVQTLAADVQDGERACLCLYPYGCACERPFFCTEALLSADIFYGTRVWA